MSTDMKMRVTTKITSYLDVDTMSSEHECDIVDDDNLSSVSSDVLGAVVLGGLNATRRAVHEQFPRAGRADDQKAAKQHTPMRGSDVEAWLKFESDRRVDDAEWEAIDSMLDDYRLAADTGQPLNCIRPDEAWRMEPGDDAEHLHGHVHDADGKHVKP